LGSGFDGYLTKPIDWKQLAVLLDSLTVCRVGWTPVSRSLPAAPAPEPASPGVLDLTRALRTVDGDRKLLSRIAGLFAKELPRTLQTLRLGEESRDLPTILRAAHTLKGTALNLGARPLADVAGRVEEAARAQQLSEALSGLAALRVEADRVLPELQRLAQPS
jgi:HPt (histidine-containing phosphotransfer) domain-containing protein